MIGTDRHSTGPLHGVRVIEFGGLGPGPFAGMLLADMGADVITVENPETPPMAPAIRTIFRSRRSVYLDLKTPAGRDIALDLLRTADVLVEVFRPGVMERLGLGPSEVHQENDRLVYARMTGWGQSGPLAERAGHDINYLAVSGVLDRIGRSGQAPVPPGNYVGDLGGGGMLLAVGILGALVERDKSGLGQTLDVSILDAASLFLVSTIAQEHLGVLLPRGENLLDSGAPFYDCYQTLDNEYVAVGCIEDKFYTNFLQLLDLSPHSVPDRGDRTQWPALRNIFADRIRQRTRQDWTAAAEGIDCCLTPVLRAGELSGNLHHQARDIFTPGPVGPTPNPAPRFSRTPLGVPREPPRAGKDTEEVLRSTVGYNDEHINVLRERGAFGLK